MFGMLLTIIVQKSILYKEYYQWKLTKNYRISIYIFPIFNKRNEQLASKFYPFKVENMCAFFFR